MGIGSSRVRDENRYRLDWASAAEALAFGAGGLGRSVTWRPDLASAPDLGRYQTWAEVYAAISALPGVRVVAVDDRVTTPAVMTAGTYDMTCVQFVGLRAFESAVACDDGVTFLGTGGFPQFFRGQLTFGNTTAPVWSPSSFNVLFDVSINNRATSTQPVISAPSGIVVNCIGPNCRISRTAGGAAPIANAAGTCQVRLRAGATMSTDALSGAGNFLVSTDGTSPLGALTGPTGTVTVTDLSERTLSLVGTIDGAAGAVSGFAAFDPLALSAADLRLLHSAPSAGSAQRLRGLAVNPFGGNTLVTPTTFQLLVGGVASPTGVVTVPALSVAIARTGRLDQTLNIGDGLDVEVSNAAGGLGNSMRFSAVVGWSQ